MKKQKSLFSLLTAFFSLLPTLLFSQWLETTIYPTDSFSVITYPRAFTYNPTNNKIYLGGADANWVIVIDGTTNEKIAKIPTGRNVFSLCYNPTNNKVYSANKLSNSVTVIDGITNSRITTITVGSSPRAFVYNPTNNLVYCANAWSNDVTVLMG